MSWCSEASARRSVGRQREADRVGGESDLRDGAAYGLPGVCTRPCRSGIASRAHQGGARREEARRGNGLRRKQPGRACYAVDSP
jgi:hypothetical protein